MVIGIDLGTTYSAAAYIDSNGQAQMIPNSEGEYTTPSVVLFEDGMTIVGQRAKENLLLDSLNTVSLIKRQMGNKAFLFENEEGAEYKPEDISAMILKRLVTDSEAYIGEAVDAAVITVPAYFGDAERKATMDAARIAGLKVLALINEPTAAALGYGLSRGQDGSLIMVYDLGGGTFDVTLLKIEAQQFTVLSSYGDKSLGGANFDDELMKYAYAVIKDQTGVDMSDDMDFQQSLREKCEKAKKALSTSMSTFIPVSANGKKVKITITRTEFERMIAQHLLITEDSIDTVMMDAGITARKIDKVLLVGGSSRIPAVKELIRKKTGIEPSCELHPDHAVAIGAAYYAQNLNEAGVDGVVQGDKQDEVKIQDVSTHGLGVVARNQEGKMENYIILPRNTALPASNKQVFGTSVNNQRELIIELTEGDESDVRYVTKIGQAHMAIEPGPKGSPVGVGISLDVNGIIHVSVIDARRDIVLYESDIQRAANMSEEELREREKHMKNIEVE